MATLNEVFSTLSVRRRYEVWFLRFGLAIVLIFIGAKMLLSDAYSVPIAISLFVVAGILAITIGSSILWKEKEL